uniref:Uncharacterized protein n=1 Tax=Planktothrix agardhii TaxID=1160 RepID=A0A1J1JLZ3_PLAAG|nr:protein of unknown function [Planktothrix agardhii]
MLILVKASVFNVSIEREPEIATVIFIDLKLSELEKPLTRLNLIN